MRKATGDRQTPPKGNSSVVTAAIQTKPVFICCQPAPACRGAAWLVAVIKLSCEIPSDGPLS
jgi:hypothetical protein